MSAINLSKKITHLQQHVPNVQAAANVLVQAENAAHANPGIIKMVMHVNNAVPVSINQAMVILHQHVPIVHQLVRHVKIQRVIVQVVRKEIILTI